MINQKKILAIIPARGGSKGLPGKNIRMLHGLPLIAWPIQAALASQYIDRVIVTTDDDSIAKIAEKYGADVPFIRPAKFAQDTSSSSEAIIHAINFCIENDREYDYFVLLEPTSPLTETVDIDRALELLIQKQKCSIVGVCIVQDCHPLYCATIDKDDLLKPYNRDIFAEPVRRQDLDELYFFEGSLYISEVQKYLQMGTFYHDSTLPYIVPTWKSLEIDTLLDFILVEAVMKNKTLLEQEVK